SWKSSWMPPGTGVVSPGVAHFRTELPATSFMESMHSLCTFIIRWASGVDFLGMGIMTAPVGLDGQVFLNQGMIELGNLAVRTDAAIVDHQEGIAELARHLDVLLGQQQRDAELLVQHQQRF